MERNSPEGERGLIPSPQSPLKLMHKAEKKYEIGKVLDAEEAKQRQLKAILNKLTPQNFDRLFEQVKAVNIHNAITLTDVVSQIFEKVWMEPTFCEMYANFCSHLASEFPDLSVDNEKITFKRLLVNKCQEEFERGEREQEEANKVDEAEARRRMSGNIRFFGELYKKKMLTERIMHECIKKLLGQCQDPYEEDVEALCKLMSSIGERIDHPKAKEHLDVYFERLKILSNNMNLSSRARFMLMDVIDLRRNRWQVRRKVYGRKKIEKIHKDAVRERQAQAQAGRMGRGMGYNQSSRRNPMDFGPSGINGYGNLSERTPYGSREDLASRYMSDRPSTLAGYDHLSAPAHNINFGNEDLRNDDQNLNRPVATSPRAQSQGPIVSQNSSSDERLREMSLSATR